jgi:phosphatidylserine/phosphatidylglycerophosphate/cardiolipin synthase-like enzyme
MHHKTFTIDKQATIIGGRNIADEYFDYDDRYNFRDRDVLLIGKAAGDVERTFEQFWNDSLSYWHSDLVKTNTKAQTDPARFDRLHAFACDTQNLSERMRKEIRRYPEEFKRMQSSGEVQWIRDVSFVSDIPGKNEEREGKKGGVCTDSLVALIRQARSTIDIQSPYVITTSEGKALFEQAMKRGVKVRILTNSLGSTDNHEAFSGYQRDRDQILATGVELYEYKPQPAIRYKLMIPEVQAALSYTPVYGLHSKTMIIDGYVTVIGTYNLDPRSANLNTECVAIVRSQAFAKNVMKYIEEEFRPENAWRITKDFNPDKEASFNKRVKVQSRKIIPKKVL